MRLAILLLPLALSACALTAGQTPQSLTTLPTGAYQMEKPHASLLARVKHMGLSYYTVRLTDFDATLDFDPANPAASKVHAIINPLSVQADHPTDTGWDKKIGTDFFKGAQFPADRLRQYCGRHDRPLHRHGHRRSDVPGRHKAGDAHRHL